MSTSSMEDHALRAIFATAYGLIGWHCWMKRTRIAELSRRLTKATCEFMSRPWSQLCALFSPEHGQNALVAKELDAMRVQNFRWMAHLVSVVMAVGLVAASFGRPYFFQQGLQCNFYSLYLVGIPFYAVFLMVSCEVVSLTPRRVTGLYVAMNAMMMARLWSLQPDPLFYHMNNVRLVMRAMLTLGVMNSRVSTVMNVAWSSLLIYKEVFQQSQQDAWFSNLVFAMVELVTGMAFQALIWFGVSMVASHTRTSSGRVVSHSVQEAVLSLLAVFCDADLVLNHALQIQEPSPKAGFLLREDVAKLADRSIVDFVAEADRERFQGFLDERAGPEDGAGGAATARLLQVHLRDASGRTFPAQVFHAAIPNLDGGQSSGHLLGLRDCAPASREAALDEPGALGPGVLPAPLTWVEGQFGSSMQDEVASLPSSLRDRDGRTVVQRLDLPEVERLEIRFDPLSGDLMVKEFRVCFQRTANVEGKQRLPRLLDWVHETRRKELWDWVQTQYQAAVYGPEADADFGPLPVHWPCADDDPDDVWHANTSVIHFPEADGSEDEDEAEGAEAAASAVGPAAGRSPKSGAGEVQVVDDEGQETSEAVLTLRSLHQLSVVRRNGGLSGLSLHSLGRSSHRTNRSGRHSIRSGTQKKLSGILETPPAQDADAPE